MSSEDRENTAGSTSEMETEDRAEPVQRKDKTRSATSTKLDDVLRERDELAHKLSEAESRLTDIASESKKQVEKLREQFETMQHELTFEKERIDDPEIRDFLKTKWRTERRAKRDLELKDFISEYRQRDGNLLQRLTSQSTEQERPKDHTRNSVRDSNVRAGSVDPKTISKMTPEEWRANRERIMAEIFGRKED